jgi:hypothetical protein
MTEWATSWLLWGKREPPVAPTAIRHFTTDDLLLSHELVIEGDAWVVDTDQPRALRLFEVTSPEVAVGACLLTYRANLKSANLAGRAFLEMWCRIPGRGEFFSRGLAQTLSGTTEWASFEIPFRLKKGQQPDLIKLNLTVEGHGKVWIKDVELLKTPR